jgi:primosomal protein N'
VVVVGGEELLEGLAAARVKSVLGSSGAALPARLVELARWMAGYYVCPLGMVLATMMPAAVKAGVGKRVRIVLERPDEAADSGKRQATSSRPARVRPGTC